MTHATCWTSSGFKTSAFSVTAARNITYNALAVALAFMVLGNVAFAQYYEEEPVTIVPRTQGNSGPSAKPADSAQASPQQPAVSPAQSQPADSTFVLPPGTSLPLGLVRPLALKSSSAKGAGVYLQVTFPITVAGRMVVPPGAYVQGTIESMRTDRGANPDLEFELRSASLIFSTGYTVPLAGAVHMVHKYARLAPGSSASGQSTMALIPIGKSNVPSPVMAATGTTPTLPPLPSMGNGARTAIIAVGVASAAAIVAFSAIAISHHNDVYLEAGTPLEIILAEPLKLDANSVTNALQQYSAQMSTNPSQIVKPPEKMCYDPGSPGTPDTVIPGTPPSPPTVIPGVNGAPDMVIPGSPGTPDTVIPGTPGTSGSWHKCPIFK